MIPPFNGITIVLAVAAIELSAYLLAINAILLLLTLWLGGRRRVPAAIVLAANCIVCALPSLALRGTGVDAPVSYRDVNVPITERTIPVTLGSERSKIRAYLPIVPSRTPAIFAMYGGAWRNGGPRNDATLNRGLAHHGYAVFALDYRHAPKYRFPAALDDVRSEIGLILKNTSRYNIDPQRTAVLGHSSGGQLAALTAFEPRSRIRALIIYSGAIDLAMGWKYPPTPDPIGVRRIIEQYIGEPPAAAPERYRAANAFELIRPGLPPALSNLRRARSRRRRALRVDVSRRASRGRDSRHIRAAAVDGTRLRRDTFRLACPDRISRDAELLRRDAPDTSASVSCDP